MKYVSWKLVFLYFTAVPWYVHNFGYIMTWKSYSFVCILHNFIMVQDADFPESVELTKCSLGEVCVPSVCLRLSPFPQWYFLQYTGLRFFSSSSFLSKIVAIFAFYIIIIIINSVIWTIGHCKELDRETTVRVIWLFMLSKCNVTYSIIAWG